MSQDTPLVTIGGKPISLLLLPAESHSAIWRLSAYARQEPLSDTRTPCIVIANGHQLPGIHGAPLCMVPA